MEELKAIFTIIKDLPNLAIWVFVIIYAYKVAVLGSIYGVIRYVVNKFVELDTIVFPGYIAGLLARGSKI